MAITKIPILPVPDETSFSQLGLLDICMYRDLKMDGKLILKRVSEKLYPLNP
jgi:hypothetical protein